MTPRKTSEFGKGLTYCLGMFLAHAERLSDYKRIAEKTPFSDYPQLWFNAAADHLYELVIPEGLPEKLRKKLKRFQKKVLNYGHGQGMMGEVKVTDKDVEVCLNEAKELLREIDNWIGVKTIKADFE